MALSSLLQLFSAQSKFPACVPVSQGRDLGITRLLSLGSESVIPLEAREEAQKASPHMHGSEGGRRGHSCATGAPSAFVPLRLPSWINRRAELPLLPEGMSSPTRALVIEPKRVAISDFIHTQERAPTATDVWQ